MSSERWETPFVVVDLDVVRERYLSLARAIPAAAIFFAVKANPAPEVLELLTDLGASFDVASPGEVDACLAAGADPAQISYGNTVKKVAAIEHAYAKGVRLFAVDCERELDKVIATAPGSTVFCRMLCDGMGADWPLSRKFGCETELVSRLMLRAADHGLGVGVSFHVGSQQRDVHTWDRQLAIVADLYSMLRARDIEPAVVNIGGGFPGSYLEPAPPIEAYGDAITLALRRRLGPDLPFVIAEPGRYLVADAGVLQTEVVLVARKSDYDEQRWVYLDVGMFGGLAEAMGEAIRYRMRTPHDGTECGPVVHRRSDVRQRGHPLSAPLVPPAPRSAGRRSHRHRGGRRVHDDLLDGRLQRLRAPRRALSLDRMSSIE